MIPKKIYYCWFGKATLPKNVQKCISSWRKYCPDYKIIRLDESNYDVTQNIYMKQAYENKKWAFATDYARLDIIYRNGGIYLDTDVEVLRPFDGLLENRAFAGIEKSGNHYNVNLGLGFGAEAGTEIIKNMMKQYNEITFIKSDGKIDLTPSPILITNYLRKIGYVEENVTQVITELTIFPYEFFCPYDLSDGRISLTSNTYSIHHYDASWVTPYERLRGKIYRLINKHFGKKIATLAKKFFGRK